MHYDIAEIRHVLHIINQSDQNGSGAQKTEVERKKLSRCAEIPYVTSLGRGSTIL